MARSYLKEWRKHRRLTQDQVVECLTALDDPTLPQTTASLSRIENGKQPYGQRIIEALADIYKCEPHEVIGRDPAAASDVIDMLFTLTESQRHQIKVIVEALARDAQ